MKVTLTESGDGFYNIWVDDVCKASVKKHVDFRTPEQSLEEAKKIFMNYYENKGKDRVIMEFEIKEV